jgi:TolB-like protein
MKKIALLIVAPLCFCTPPALVQETNPSGNDNTAAQETEQTEQRSAEQAVAQVQRPTDNTPAKQAEAAPQVQKQSVAIYMNGAEPPALKGAHKVIGSELAKALTASNAYSAVDRTQEALDIIEKEHVYQRSGAVDDEQIKELGKQLGVRYLCIAEVNEVMGSYFLAARLVDVETARILKETSTPGTMKDIYQLVEISQETARELVRGSR